jgi:hypothetical protein
VVVALDAPKKSVLTRDEEAPQYPRYDGSTVDGGSYALVGRIFCEDVGNRSPS